MPRAGGEGTGEGEGTTGRRRGVGNRVLAVGDKARSRTDFCVGVLEAVVPTVDRPAVMWDLAETKDVGDARADDDSVPNSSSKISCDNRDCIDMRLMDDWLDDGMRSARLRSGAAVRMRDSCSLPVGLTRGRVELELVWRSLNAGRSGRALVCSSWSLRTVTSTVASGKA